MPHTVYSNANRSLISVATQASDRLVVPAVRGRTAFHLGLQDLELGSGQPARVPLGPLE